MVTVVGRTQREQKLIDRDNDLEAIARKTFPQAKISSEVYINIRFSDDNDLRITVNQEDSQISTHSKYRLQDAIKLGEAYEAAGFGDFTVKKDYVEPSS